MQSLLQATKISFYRSEIKHPRFSQVLGSMFDVIILNKRQIVLK